MTFLKWAGGKTQLIPEIMNLLPDMKKIKGYIEPFIGGGSIFFHLKEQGYLEDKPVYLSDMNEYLINAYIVIRDNWRELIPYMEKLEKYNSEKIYYKIRDNFPDGLNTTEKAACFIYMNKMCFNGGMRVNSEGRFNQGFCQKEQANIFNMNEINQCSRLLNGININIMSYEKIVKISDIKEYFVYMDPPYDNVSHDGYTKDRFIEKRKYLLSTFRKLDELGCKVMLSNSSTAGIMKEFKDYNIKIVKAKRMFNANGEGRGAVDEVIITNYMQHRTQMNLADY